MWGFKLKNKMKNIAIMRQVRLLIFDNEARCIAFPSFTAKAQILVFLPKKQPFFMNSTATTCTSVKKATCIVAKCSTGLTQHIQQFLVEQNFRRDYVFDGSPHS